ncbi:MAG: ABC transporter ATP-binding protein [Bacteroidales bacterium]
MDGIIAETTDLAIGYRNRKRVATVMKGLTLRARHGELVALIGRNGTGKSTLLRTLAGIQPSLEGEILIEGSPCQDWGQRLPRMVSFVSTEPVAVRNIRVRDVVALGRFPYTNWIGSLTEGMTMRLWKPHWKPQVSPGWPEPEHRRHL